MTLGATHFRLVNNASILSNYYYNDTLLKYYPTNSPINGINKTTYSNYIPLGGIVGSNTTIISTLTNSPAITVTAVLIGCIGIEFFQLVNGVYFLLNAENSMRLENVF